MNKDKGPGTHVFACRNDVERGTGGDGLADHWRRRSTARLGKGGRQNPRIYKGDCEGFPAGLKRKFARHSGEGPHAGSTVVEGDG